MRSTYQVLKAESLAKLELVVNNWCKAGWELQGGVAMTASGMPCQAISRPALKSHRNRI